MKHQKTSPLVNQLATELFKLKGENIYPKYRLINGGEVVVIDLDASKSKSFGVHHISEEGLLCDDLETFIEWEMFS